jgi:hypothetical protein
MNAHKVNQPEAVLCGAPALWYNRRQRQAWSSPLYSSDGRSLGGNNQRMWRSNSLAKSSKGRQRRDWRRTVFLIISVLIVLSMLLSMAIAFAPASP